MDRVGTRSGRVYKADLPVENIRECYEEVSDEDKQKYSTDEESYKIFSTRHQTSLSKMLLYA